MTSKMSSPSKIRYGVGDLRILIGPLLHSHPDRGPRWDLCPPFLLAPPVNCLLKCIRARELRQGSEIVDRSHVLSSLISLNARSIEAVVTGRVRKSRKTTLIFGYRDIFRELRHCSTCFGSSKFCA